MYCLALKTYSDRARNRLQLHFFYWHSLTTSIFKTLYLKHHDTFWQDFFIWRQKQGKKIMRFMNGCLIHSHLLLQLLGGFYHVVKQILYARILYPAKLEFFFVSPLTFNILDSKKRHSTFPSNIKKNNVKYYIIKHLLKELKVYKTAKKTSRNNLYIWTS